MSTIKMRVLGVIRTQFEKQGGTGYTYQMEALGCQCAGDVAEGCKETPGLCLSDREIIRLMEIHDGELLDCAASDMEIELVHDDYFGRMYRARLGTPAYDRVMAKLEEWAAS